jgi:hypothetical protein
MIKAANRLRQGIRDCLTGYSCLTVFVLVAAMLLFVAIRRAPPVWVLVLLVGTLSTTALLATMLTTTFVAPLLLAGVALILLLARVALVLCHFLSFMLLSPNGKTDETGHAFR